MRRLFWFLVFVAMVVAVVGPGVLLYYSASLPDLSTASAIRAALARRVEAERVATSDFAARLKVEKFSVLPLNKLPTGLVLGLLAAEGCPEYQRVPKEILKERAQRLFTRATDNSGGNPGPGRCQMRFADLISETVGAADPMHAMIADYHVLEALTVEELLTYRLASTYYTQGIIGTRHASQELFRKEPHQLDLSESVELLLAESAWDDFTHCKNPAKLKNIRDNILSQMEAFALIQPNDARVAKSKALHCHVKK